MHCVICDGVDNGVKGATEDMIILLGFRKLIRPHVFRSTILDIAQEIQMTCNQKVPEGTTVDQLEPLLGEGPAVDGEVGEVNTEDPHRFEVPGGNANRKGVDQTMDEAPEGGLVLLQRHPIVLQEVVPDKMAEQETGEEVCHQAPREESWIEECGIPSTASGCGGRSHLPSREFSTISQPRQP